MKIVIKHLSGSDAGRRDVFPLGRILIGRDEDCDVRFHAQRDREVSGHHVEIQANGETMRIIDLESTNGTWVNGHEIKDGPLASGDEIELGAGGPRLRIVVKRGLTARLLGFCFAKKTHQSAAASSQD